MWKTVFIFFAQINYLAPTRPIHTTCSTISYLRTLALPQIEAPGHREFLSYRGIETTECVESGGELMRDGGIVILATVSSFRRRILSPAINAWKWQGTESVLRERSDKKKRWVRQIAYARIVIYHRWTARTDSQRFHSRFFCRIFPENVYNSWIGNWTSLWNGSSYESSAASSIYIDHGASERQAVYGGVRSK